MPPTNDEPAKLKAYSLGPPLQSCPLKVRNVNVLVGTRSEIPDSDDLEESGPEGWHNPNLGMAVGRPPISHLPGPGPGRPPVPNLPYQITNPHSPIPRLIINNNNRRLVTLNSKTGTP